MIREYLEAHFQLLAYCGRYGGFPPPLAQEFDLPYLRTYAEAVNRLIKEETKGLKK